MSRHRTHGLYRAAPRLLAVAACVVAAGCTALERRGVEGERVLIHVVDAGETVEDVADDYYGDLDRARDIRRFNGLGRDDVAEAGTKLRIPMAPDDMESLQRRRAARVPYNEGLSLATKGSFLDASVKFRQSVELDPRFAQGHFNLGLAYQRIKAHEKALDELRVATKLRPDDADYRCAVGGAYFHLERYDRAVREFKAAVGLDPFHAKARYSLAATLEKLGRSRDARLEWQRYLQIDDSSEWADEARARLEELDAQ